MVYDPKSRVAEEFINHEEILDTLRYAEDHKNDLPMIEKILEKAATFKGMSHREAAVLMACTDPEVNKKIQETAIRVKEHIYGSRIVLFAPLYLSNYCVNGCVYCPYHYKNKHIARRLCPMSCRAMTSFSISAWVSFLRGMCLFWR